MGAAAIITSPRSRTEWRVIRASAASFVARRGISVIPQMGVAGAEMQGQGGRCSNLKRGNRNERKVDGLRIAILLAVSALLAGTAAAGGLPKGARKLSTAQVKALYSGHTGVWSKSKEYFVPDGTVRHVKNDGTLYGVGKWRSRGNTVSRT